MIINNKNMRDRILEIIKRDPRCANDDKLLIATVWWYEGWKDKELYKHLKSVSSPETIRRTRAKLAEEGLIESSDNTQVARKIAEMRAREDLGY